ncbi:MAG: hypothetical protein KTR13_04375 [Saprospiraceae bacterium]|nr:hypothetical protein [Saprospiraceae bacterium]
MEPTKQLLLNLLHEQTSPLFRLVSVSDAEHVKYRSFSNNIVAFHVGGGYVLSVSHNLRTLAPLLRSADQRHFQTILSHCTSEQAATLEQYYKLDPKTEKFHAAIRNSKSFQAVQQIFKAIKYDNRWETLYANKVNQPHLIIEFEEKAFYKQPLLTKQFPQERFFYTPKQGIYSYILPLELKKIWYSADIALYKIVDTPQAIIEQIPALPISYEMLLPPQKLICLQAAPNSMLGRMINESRMEGLVDQHSVIPDGLGSTYVHRGLRYLLKGYFRFGSSGAPYVIYDEQAKQFKVNAIQSEASPIQLSIKNDRKGNFQYVNAIASPFYLIRDELAKAMA